MDNMDLLRKKLISSAKKKVQEKYEGKEVHIIKSVNLLEDLDSASNLFIEQLREWYSTHFPELNNLVKENKPYLKLVYEIGDREKFTEKKLKDAGIEEQNIGKIMSSAKKTMGSKTEEKDMAEIKTLALNCYNLREQREYLTKYLEESMKKELPNFTELAGAVIGAKILAKVGTKKKLAFMPASGIQVIGAEKALFLHKKKGAKSPKYGYLFQHPMIKAARYENKGKIARSLAAKLAIAIKKDYFHNTSSAKEMKKELEKRAEELSKRKPTNKPEPEHRERRYDDRERLPERRERKPEYRERRPEHRERTPPRRDDRRKPNYNSRPRTDRKPESRKPIYDSRPRYTEKPEGSDQRESRRGKNRSYLTPKPNTSEKSPSPKPKSYSEKKPYEKKPHGKPFGKKKAFGKPNFKKGASPSKKFGKKKN
ncbi:MAG: NOP5/NOP56 family protein [Candidatus Diapherotrites archaeon]